MPLLLSPFLPFFDREGDLRPDALVHVFEAGTTEPAPIFLDADLAILAANPIASQGGAMPALYVEGGDYRVRVTASSVVLRDLDNLRIEGSATAGPGTPTVVGFTTGDLKDRYALGPLAGWVRMNGGTIGPIGSSATERQNDDTHDLYVHLWNTDANLAVAGGRGTTAENDWLAGKPIALPDHRGRARVALDDLGTTTAGRLIGALFGFGNGTTLGAYGGASTHTLLAAHLPAHAHTASGTSSAFADFTMSGTTGADGAHGHTISLASNGSHTHGGTTGNDGGHNHTGTTATGGTHSHSGTTASDGAHTHNYGTAPNKDGSIQTPGASFANVWYGGTQNVATTSSGLHNHTFDTDSATPHSHTFTTSTAPNHNHPFTTDADGAHIHTATASSAPNHTHTFTTAAGGGHSHTISLTTSSIGSGTAFSLASPFLLVTTYIKL